MFVTKIKSVLAVVLVVGLALGGVGVGVGLSTNSAAVAQEDTPKAVTGQMIVHGILESVNAKKSVVTVKAVVGNDASSVMRLMAHVSDKKPAKGGVADALLKESKFNPDNYPKLVNVFVQPGQTGADGIIGTGSGVAKKRLKIEDLKAGQVVMLQLAANRTTGFVIVFVRVLSDEKKEEKP